MFTAREKTIMSVAAAILALVVSGPQLLAQLQQSAGGTTALSAGSAIVGKVGIDQTTPGTTNLVQIGSTLPAFAATPTFNMGTMAALINGVANVGFVRTLPSSCTQSTNFANTANQVATGAGTSVTSTTTCVTFAFANNITNSPVTLRLADKQGTPVIWLGGNADFTIPANSNLRIPLEGVTFTSGITAIAGTATAINLQMNGVQ